MIDENLKVS